MYLKHDELYYQTRYNIAPVFIPLMGAFFSGKRDAYVYLVQSVKRFLPVKDFCRMAEECGFEVAKVVEVEEFVIHGTVVKFAVAVNL